MLHRQTLGGLCPVSRQSPREELLNGLTHGIGLLLSIAGFVFLLVLTINDGSVRNIAACSIYGVTLILLYTSSTLYHTARCLRRKRVFRIIDHASIYMFIAGTYTPFTVVSLGGGWGWSLLGIVWGLAAVGIVVKMFHTGQYVLISTFVYLVMGWLAAIAIVPLAENMGVGGVAWLLTGGVAYTVGTVFFLAKRLRFSHAVWHLFVLAGSACHYVAIVNFVLPGA